MSRIHVSNGGVTLRRPQVARFPRILDLVCLHSTTVSESFAKQLCEKRLLADISLHVMRWHFGVRCSLGRSPCLSRYLPQTSS